MYHLYGVSEGEYFEYNGGNYVVYEDQAENGDTILRYSTEREAENNGITDYSKNRDMIIVKVTTADGTQETYSIGTNSDGNYVTLYNSSADVNSYSENFLCELGNVIETGTVQAHVLDGDFDGLKQNSEEYYETVVSEFTENFYDALLNYSESHESAVETTQTSIEQENEER